MQYKIGDVARILGISTDLLRYYEKKGVVTPTKDKHTDYRYYDAWDINFLIDCLWFKSFGFGIPQTAYLVSESSYEDLVSMLDGKEEELKASLRRQELLLQRIRRHSEQVIRVKDLVGSCDVVQSPEIVCYLNRFDSSFENNPDLQKLSKQWLQYMPFLQRYFEMSAEPAGEAAHQYAWGFSLEMEYVQEFSVSMEPPVIHKPSEECIHSVFKSSGKNGFSPEHIRYLFDFADRSGFTVTGNARGNLVCSILEDGANTGYFEVWLPICRE